MKKFKTISIWIVQLILKLIQKNDIQNLSKYRYKKSYNKNTSIYFFGNFRNDIDELCKK